MSGYNKQNERIEKYCNGELTGVELEWFEKNLKEEIALQKEVKVECLVNDVFSDTDLLEFRKVILKARRLPGLVNLKKWFLAAAIIALILCPLSICLYETMDFESSGKTGLSTKKSTTVQGKGEIQKNNNEKDLERKFEYLNDRHGASYLLSDRLEPYPYLEGLVGEKTRNIGFSLIAPDFHSEVAAGDSLCYKWRPNSELPTRIELVSNKGFFLKSWTIEKNTTFCISTAAYPPGLYYWKLIRSDELLCVGRFILN